MVQVEYGPIREEEVGAAARMMHHAFAGPLDGSEKWLRDLGLENIRVMREGDRPLACLSRVPMGQFYGGRSVKMLGIAGVAVAPEARGRGLALEMMRHAMREGRADGFAISCLYASTLSLYRQVGFEQAGHRFITHLPIHRIDVKERTGSVRTLEPADEDAVRACYAGFAATFDGTLDRGAYVWQRTRKVREETFHGFGIDAPGGGLGGYVFLSQTRNPETGHFNLSISDMAFTDRTSARRLLGFFADFGTTGENAVFFAGPLHPLLSLMDARHYRVEKRDFWMVRILDLPAAIASRGYSPHNRGEFEVAVRDELIETNAGVWSIRVEAGRGTATRRDTPSPRTLECDVRGLAPLFSGLYTPKQLGLLGWITGSPGAISAADGLIGGGGTPWMSDMF